MEIDDIKNVTTAEEYLEKDEDIEVLENVHIIGVNRLDIHKGCLNCGGKIVKDEEDEELGGCMKCKMVQCLEDCKVSFNAHLTLETASGQKVTLRVFHQALIDIVDNTDLPITKRTLLKAGVFSARLHDRVIQSIFH